MIIIIVTPTCPANTQFLKLLCNDLPAPFTLPSIILRVAVLTAGCQPPHCRPVRHRRAGGAAVGDGAETGKATSIHSLLHRPVDGGRAAQWDGQAVDRHPGRDGAWRAWTSRPQGQGGDSGLQRCAELGEGLATVQN